MLKKFLLACSLCLLQPQTAQALPGKTLAETQTWVKKHPFLSTWLVAGTDPPEGFQFERVAFRELQDHWFVDVHLTFDPPGEGKSRQYSKSLFDYLFLVQKEYVGNPDSEDGIVWDPRPWKDVACKDIWYRDNQTAALLLSKIYSPAVAEDFKTAKLAYQGPYMIPHRIGAGHEGPLWWPDKANDEDLNRWGLFRRIRSDVSLYIGTLFAYEVRDDIIPGTESEAYSRPGCIGLKINPRSWGIETTGTLKHNQKMYARWQQMQKAKEQRNAPADIKVE